METESFGFRNEVSQCCEAHTGVIKNTVQYAKIENKGFHVSWIKRHGFLIYKPVCFLDIQNLQNIALVNYLTKL